MSRFGSVISAQCLFGARHVLRSFVWILLEGPGEAGQVKNGRVVKSLHWILPDLGSSPALLAV